MDKCSLGVHSLEAVRHCLDRSGVQKEERGCSQYNAGTPCIGVQTFWCEAEGHPSICWDYSTHIHCWGLLSAVWQYRFMKKERIKLNSASGIMTMQKDDLAGDTKQRRMQAAY